MSTSPLDDLHIGSDAAGLPLRNENEIATRIQQAILPGEVYVEGLEISAGMLPTESVGGDYYDIIPVKDGCWIGIGDVAGHGLVAGMIMLMIQSALQGLVTLSPNASPADILCALNSVLFENIRRRMKRDEHVTLSLVRYSADGTVVFAGAHEDMLLCRAHGDFESIPLNGAWLGAARDIRAVTKDSTLQLQPGDLLTLYTDGIIEARKTDGQEFGVDRLQQMIIDLRDESPRVIRSAVIERARTWGPRVEDDMTMVMVRCQGVYWPT
jgi:serine phosphatase RsbU (regulator of sigma subunit)